MKFVLRNVEVDVVIDPDHAKGLANAPCCGREAEDVITLRFGDQHLASLKLPPRQ